MSNGSGADVYTGTRAVHTDVETQNKSFSRVLLSFSCYHFVLYTRCYARQLRSAGTYLSLFLTHLAFRCYNMFIVSNLVNACGFVFANCFTSLAYVMLVYEYVIAEFN